MRKAEIFMNTTQQSAESAYISEIQAQGVVANDVYECFLCFP